MNLSAATISRMSIELSSADQARLEQMVEIGRFETIEQAVHAGLEALFEDEQWREYAKNRIDAGIAAAANNDFASNQEVDALFARYERKLA